MVDGTEQAHAFEKLGQSETATASVAGLPVAGYLPQSEYRLALVNANKEAEERILRILDALAADPDIDRRWFSIGRTAIEQGFMAVNRAVFQPNRAALPEDAARDARTPGAQDTRSRGEPRP